MLYFVTYQKNLVYYLIQKSGLQILQFECHTIIILSADYFDFIVVNSELLFPKKAGYWLFHMK